MPIGPIALMQLVAVAAAVAGTCDADQRNMYHEIHWPPTKPTVSARRSHFLSVSSTIHGRGTSGAGDADDRAPRAEPW